ncbi:hypothetical protein CLAFUW4_20048 [Fulvia fulva]|uniref:uncharacterized protein n=1 Tax=Passalora fulva TaxID=5499 RepID=UPI0028526DE4|nr:uncharacterized protein CLAFUR5_20048 [Fulvia fulva]KAK4624647.1 hypothetical protein CLAFUR4_20048 [Fulvia fulva]KAK4625317.1 hypothetical protein CLAFUR0_20048 [Fulvia fulva]WMI38905.1 hypothetical protein CLAFUR5_20048 [Fulvia fulva]WPV14536.1 hypothetical protein CLAFUW4_20048 [Fulvia fulva]WPV30566.1 hypothetical protein CLAFUW7_20048 [Fulvia fulva]
MLTQSHAKRTETTSQTSNDSMNHLATVALLLLHLCAAPMSSTPRLMHIISRVRATAGEISCALCPVPRTLLPLRSKDRTNRCIDGHRTDYGTAQEEHFAAHRRCDARAERLRAVLCCR